MIDGTIYDNGNGDNENSRPDMKSNPDLPVQKPALNEKLSKI